MRVGEPAGRPAEAALDGAVTRPARVRRVTGAGTANDLETLLQARRELPEVESAQPVLEPAAIDRARISVGVMRQEIADLVATLTAAPEQTREDRVALWALRGELSKLTALDEYVSGFLRG